MQSEGEKNPIVEELKKTREIQEKFLNAFNK